ncbi:MAG TPA: hypothetical protein VED41_05895 [Solirubrobacteraceae bacterium]|nr:hypothetical protein [Solirubrobacteraceae bacterium]
MSELSQPSPSSHAPAALAGEAFEDASSPQEEDAHQPDTLPVALDTAAVASVRPANTWLPDERRPVMPAVQAAAVAASGFVAGAAVFGFVSRRRRRAGALVKGGRARRRAAPASARGAGRTAELVQIVSSRSLLVDVHLLGGPGGR